MKCRVRHPRGWQRIAKFSMIAIFIGVAVIIHAADCYAVRRGENENSQRDKRAVMVIIGASYAKDWDIRSSGHYMVVNKGVGGEETRQMLTRFDRDVVRLRPSRVLIWGFINDIFRSPRENISDTLTKTRENILAMVETATAMGIQPILATEVPVASPDSVWDNLQGLLGSIRGKQSYQDYINGHVRDVNNWIRALAKEKHIVLLDFERQLADQKGGRQKQYATEDGSHLSKEAYSVLTSYTDRILGNQKQIVQ